MLVTVGGDHSIATGSIHALLRKYPDLKVIWVDAHPDFVNIHESKRETGNYHGMPVGHLTGLNKLPAF